MAKKPKTAGKKLLSFLVVSIVVLYIAFQAYRSIFAGVDTEMTVAHSVYESLDVQGVVFRSETVIPDTAGGHVYYTIENGTRVAKNSAIASVYPSAADGRVEEEIRNIDEQVAALREIEADGSSGRIPLDVINEQLNDAVYNVVYDTDSGVLASMEGAKFELLSVLSKKQLITGKSVNFSRKIQQLEARKKTLKSEYTPAKSVVYAPVAGYFVNQTDGFENLLKTEALAGMTVDKVQEYLDMQPQAVGTGGKIVGGYEWFLTCVVPDSYYNKLAVGKALTLRLSFVTNEQIPVTVYACNKSSDGQMAIVFRSDYMSSKLSTIRKEAVEIQLVKHDGLKVPKRAIIMNDEQQAGVYVRSGNMAAFRKIKQLYSGTADYAICAEVNEDGYLRLYDDIIVGGKGLYDGKIIH